MILYIDSEICKSFGKYTKKHYLDNQDNAQSFLSLSVNRRIRVTDARY